MHRKQHDLKTDPDVFKDMWNDKKNFEIRLDDRGFCVQDRLKLRETVHTGKEMEAGQPLIYTGYSILCEVIYILNGPIYGLAPRWVIMSVRIMQKNSRY
jgi:hypothetical protein